VVFVLDVEITAGELGQQRMPEQTGRFDHLIDSLSRREHVVERRCRDDFLVGHPTS
jgi:hypothetical protein